MTKDQRVNGDGTPHVCEFDADGRCQMHPFTREVLSSKDDLIQYFRVCVDLAQKGGDTLAYVSPVLLRQAIELLNAHETFARQPIDCKHERASIKCPDCGIDFVGKMTMPSVEPKVPHVVHQQLLREDREQRAAEKALTPPTPWPGSNPNKANTTGIPCVCGEYHFERPGSTHATVGNTVHRRELPCFQKPPENGDGKQT